MKTSFRHLALLLVGSALLLTSCEYPGYYGNGYGYGSRYGGYYGAGPNQRSGTVIGAAGGATLGAIIGNQSRRPLEGALIGGILGGLAGNAIGANRDQRYFIRSGPGYYGNGSRYYGTHYPYGRSYSSGYRPHYYRSSGYASRPFSPAYSPFRPTPWGGGTGFGFGSPYSWNSGLGWNTRWY